MTPEVITCTSCGASALASPSRPGLCYGCSRPKKAKRPQAKRSQAQAEEHAKKSLVRMRALRAERRAAGLTVKGVPPNPCHGCGGPRELPPGRGGSRYCEACRIARGLLKPPALPDPSETLRLASERLASLDSTDPRAATIARAIASRVPALLDHLDHLKARNQADV